MVRFRVSTALCSGCVRATGGEGGACAAPSRDGPGPHPCVSARPFPVVQVRSARGCGALRVHARCGWGRGDADYLTSQNRPPLPPQRFRRGTRGGSGRRRRRGGGAAAGGGDVTKVGRSEKWCGFVFQRLCAAAACVPPAGRVVRAPLRRATVPGSPRACLHGHFRSRKSGRRAGAEHGCMRRRGGCMRGAGGGSGRPLYFSVP